MAAVNWMGDLDWRLYSTVAEEQYNGWRTIQWLKNNTMGEEQYNGWRTIQWLKNNTMAEEQYNDWRTIQWLKNNTMAEEQCNGCRTIQWLKNNTMAEEQYNDWRTNLHDSFKHETMKTNGHVEVQLHRWTNLGGLISIALQRIQYLTKEAESASETVCHNRNEACIRCTVPSFIP